MNVVARLLILLLSFSVSAVVLAHAGLTRSVPEGGATVVTSPAAIELVFSGKVRLVKLRVTDEEGAEVETGGSPALAPAKQFVIPVSRLSPGTYTVDWMVMGSDSHKMTGSFGFTVDKGVSGNGGQ